MAISYRKCPVDECSGNVMPNSTKGLCPRHTEMMSFLLWAIPRVRLEKKDSPIIVPGQPEAELKLDTTEEKK